MIIFNCDLDNTLIYSYKQDIGTDKVVVEHYENREIAFMTTTSYQQLKSVNECVLFVPTTTRTMEQYNRITLGVGVPKYALVCNGGVLLVDGLIDEQWYQHSLELVKDSNEQMHKAMEHLRLDGDINFEIRFIDDLFVYTKSKNPINTIEGLKSKLDCNLVDVFHNGVKVYVVPKTMSKGVGITRLRQRLGGDLVIAAGDSEFDIPMLQVADVAIIPYNLSQNHAVDHKWIVCECNQIYSDFLLDYIMDMECNVS